MSQKPLMPLDRIGEVLHAALEEIVARDGSAPANEVLTGVEKRVPLTDVERSLNKSGIPRWETNLRFYTTSCVKAGYLQKGNGYWKITDQGRHALKMPAPELIRDVNKKYNAWAAQRPKNQPSDEKTDTEIEEKAASTTRAEIYEKAEEQAQSVIEEFVHALAPYDFQKMVGHLLRGMGYFIAHDAPPGPDGGVDLIVYKDALGTIPPRIKVQVKHRRDSKVSVKEIRELHGLLNNDEVGLMVSSGGFASAAAREARAASKHVDMIDLERLVLLWQQHYERITEDGRAMLPLAPIYFLAPIEE
jgi:restriction system protein